MHLRPSGHFILLPVVVKSSLLTFLTLLYLLQTIAVGLRKTQDVYTLVVFLNHDVRPSDEETDAVV